MCACSMWTCTVCHVCNPELAPTVERRLKSVTLLRGEAWGNKQIAGKNMCYLHQLLRLKW